MLKKKQTINREEWTIGEYRLAYECLLNECEVLKKEKEEQQKYYELKLKIYKDLVQELINDK